MDTIAEAQREPKLFTSMRQPCVVGLASKSYLSIAECLDSFSNIHTERIDPNDWKPLDAMSVPHILVFDLSMDLLGFLRHYKHHHERYRWIVLALFTDDASPDLLAQCFENGLDDCLGWPTLAIVVQNKMFGLNERLVLRIQRTLELRWVGKQLGSTYDDQTSGEGFDAWVTEQPVFDVANAIDVHIPDIASSKGDFALVVPRCGGKGYVLVIAEISGVGSTAPVCTIAMIDAIDAMVRRGCDLSDIARRFNAKVQRYLTKGQFCRCALIEVVFPERLLKVWSGGFPLLYFIDGKGKIMPVPSDHAPLGVLGDAAFDDALQYFPMEFGSQLLAMSVRRGGAFGSATRVPNVEGFSRVLQDAVASLKQLDGDRDGLPSLAFEKRGGDEIGRMAAYGGVNKQLSESSFHILLEALRRGAHSLASFPPTADVEAVGPSDLITLMRVRMVESPDFLIDSKGGETMGIASASSEKVSTDGPSDWALSLKLNPQSLRQFDPLPLLFQLVREVPGLGKIQAGVYTVLSELYTNALEHGVLNLSSQLKRDAKGFSDYYRLRNDRLGALDEGYVHINLRHQREGHEHKLEIRVKDSGDGFDHQHWAHCSSLVDYAGRGIDILKSLCKSVSWQGRGNSVRAVMICSDD